MKKAVSLPPLHAVLSALLLLLLSVMLLCNNTLAAQGVRQGLTLCTETLLPALFPFLVLSELLVTRRAGDLLAGAFSRPVAALFGISGRGATALLFGVLCGAPVGSVAAEALYRRGNISKEELQRLVLFVNNPSAGFLVGAVGGAMLGSTAAGVVLFVITWLSALTVGFGLRLLHGTTESIASFSDEEALAPLSAKDLTGSVTRGFAALARIFAFVLFFSCVTACLQPLLRCGVNAPLAALFNGVLEMTAGIYGAAALASPEQAFCIIAALASFSGLSVCLQVFSVTEREGLSIGAYLLAKSCQACLAFLLATACVGSLHLRPTADATLAVFAQNPVGRWQVAGVSLFLLALLCLAAWQQKEKRRWDRSHRHQARQQISRNARKV